MDVVVTGAAGFIGSHLAERLLADGHRVRGIDAMTDYYDPRLKRANLRSALADDAFDFVEVDLVTADVAAILDGAEVVFHLAAQPGVRASWAEGFARCSDNNVLATQRLLEAASAGTTIPRFVCASSSSVYGNATTFPIRETDLPQPYSPYGVTKLAAEHLCRLYALNKGVHTVALRYFTVYGPRQRPDMGLHRFIEHALDGTPVPLFGTGEQQRDFTYVDDVVEANVLAATADVDAGAVFNVAGGCVVSVNDLLDVVGRVVGCPVRVQHLPEQAGDVAVTAASSKRLRAATTWRPRIDLDTGVDRQVAWHRTRRAVHR